jgi:hypothetical protein
MGRNNILLSNLTQENQSSYSKKKVSRIIRTLSEQVLDSVNKILKTNIKAHPRKKKRD